METDSELIRTGWEQWDTSRTGSKKLIFHIDSPEPIPMARLAEYMADFAALLGKEHRVYLEHAESGPKMGTMACYLREMWMMQRRKENWPHWDREMLEQQAADKRAERLASRTLY